MATQTKPAEIKSALLFMPDISGFTQFVSENEIIHSQQIVQELLEILIDSNQLNMQVSEIEGDAILFYRTGKKPSVHEVLKQVETMYVKFHQQLQLYDHQRICDCGACRSALNLSLKVIAHYGEVSEYKVKDHKKLFGKDVIIIHRLLKNNLNQREYILLTDALLEKEPDNPPPWFERQFGKEIYDAGEIQFWFALLSALRASITRPALPHYQFSSGASVAFTEEHTVRADMGKVFGAIFDLEERPKWMEGVKKVEILDHEKVNRVGTQHRCIINPKNNPVIVTESATIENDRIELVEMDSKGIGGCRYKLQQVSPDETRLRIEVLVKKNPFIRLMFNLLMKNKFQRRIRQSLANLHQYCRQTVKQQIEPSISI